MREPKRGKANPRQGGQRHSLLECQLARVSVGYDGLLMSDAMGFTNYSD
jgi:hypothetical protein